ncbi:MAG: DUF3858 domain-containing protein, partial [bacterium]|nr:DUF3858 domain-containing protein [bacterium]
FEKEFYRIHPFIKITNLTYVNPYDLSKPMAITCSIAIDNYLQKGGKLTSLTAVSRNLPFARIIFSNVLKTNLKERKAPFKVRCSQWVEVRESIKLPGRFTLLTPLKADTITTKSAQFTGQTKQQGNTISISRELKLNKRIFQEEEWQDVRRCVTAFKKSETGALVIRNGGSK